jgi:DNA-binding protein
MTIGERIKQRRMELGLSVDEVAEKLGKNRATVYRYESNEIENLPVGTLEPLAKILETTPAQLMGWEYEEQDENYRRIFARNLNRFLKINEKNQADIAMLLNVSQAAVSTWCTGIKLPRMDKVQALADYFGINKSDLLEDKGTQEEDNSYYIDEYAKELAQFLFKNPEYRVLFDAAKDVSADDLEMVKTIIDKFKK